MDDKAETNERRHLTKNLIVVDTTTVRLRWQCPCGAAVSIAPATLSEHAFLCASCGKGWSGAGKGQSAFGTAAERLARALHDLHTEVQKANGFRMQFEVETS